MNALDLHLSVRSSHLAALVMLYTDVGHPLASPPLEQKASSLAIIFLFRLHEKSSLTIPDV